jgi:hypothetical protein
MIDRHLNPHTHLEYADIEAQPKIRSNENAKELLHAQ